MSNHQPNLIPEELLPADSRRVTTETPLQAAIGAFQNHMEEEGFSVHTQKAFVSDLRLLGKYLGIGQPVGAIGTDNLNDFLKWMAYDRGVSCSAKTYARRVTTLKVFFGWLNKADVLVVDPATAVAQRSVTSPLPTVPSEEDISQALVVTDALRNHEDESKRDSRPHLLLTLLLKTGIKKGEAMGIVPNHVEREDEPYLFVRYKNPKMRYKERKIELDPKWLDVLDEYLEQYEPKNTLFTCTARNLEYVLRDVAEDAELDSGALSFENLRWTSALRDYNAGVDNDLIRQRMGLSKVTWRDTLNKLSRLAEKQKVVASQPR